MRLLAFVLASAALFAQVPDISGVWSPSRATGPSAPAPPTPIVLKSPYKEKYAERRAAEQAAAAKGEQLAAAGLCEPYGMPSMMTVAVYPMEVIQTPKQITIVAEAFSEVRRIYMGKPQSSLDDIDPGYYGHSVGKWEGDTLVITASNFTDATWFDRSGNFHSDALKVTERYSPLGPNAIQYEATIEDPQVFSKPWKIRMPLYKHLEPNAQLTDFRCVEMVEETIYGHLRKEQLVKSWTGTTMQIDVKRIIPPGEAVYERYISGNPPAK